MTRYAPEGHSWDDAALIYYCEKADAYYDSDEDQGPTNFCQGCGAPLKEVTVKRFAPSEDLAWWPDGSCPAVAVVDTKENACLAHVYGTEVGTREEVADGLAASRLLAQRICTLLNIEGPPVVSKELLTETLKEYEYA